MTSFIATINDVMLAASDSFAASVLVKVTLTTLLALAIVRLSRRSRAAVRHVVLAAGFAVLLALPAASVVAPAIPVAVPIAHATIQPVFEPVVDLSPAAIAAPARTRAAETLRRSPAPSLSTMLIAIWITGTLVCLLPMFLGLWQMRSLRNGSLPWRDGQSAANALAGEAGIRRRVAVLRHESVHGPMTCGVAHASIVLPMDAQTWTEEDLRRAIVHELEHVRRGDWITQCLARVVCAFYWFHPLVWAAWRQLSLEAERACDDAVLYRSEATDYADQLVGLAQRLSTAPRQPQLAMANRHDLATRVVAVLDNHQRRGRAGARWVALACGAAVVSVAAISPLKVVAQSPQTASAPRFDAATVKPCEPRSDEPLTGGARGTAGGTNASFSPGRMNVPCVTLGQLIYLAYGAYGAKEEERLVNVNAGSAADSTKVRGGPDWIHSNREKFAIEATAAGATERTVLLGSMLRTLLEERFKLKIHRETEEVPMYALKVAKGGFKLKPIKAGECDPDRESPFDPNAAIPRCGLLTMGSSASVTNWRFAGSRVSTLASRLSAALRVYVIDQTGIDGDYMIEFKFQADENTPGIRTSTDVNPEPSGFPTVFTALEEQLGLKLEKIKGPRGFLVIDHVERPSPAR